ncbi:MAG: hypothetical protein QOG51_1318, partial [Verrucomicrobiota bacterium]
MKSHIAVIISLALMTGATARAADTAEQMATDLWKASGG